MGTNKYYIEEISYEKIGYKIPAPPSSLLIDDKDYDEIVELLKNTGVLKSKEIEVVALYCCGYNYAEISQHMKCHYNTVYKIFRKAVSKLRSYYNTHPCYLDWQDVYLESISFPTSS